MEVARITAQGQITIPVEIRKKLNLKEGDKVVFFEEENGRFFFQNTALLAFNRIQKEMCGAAKKAGYMIEQELQDYVREVRQEIWEKNYADNA